MAFRLWKKAVMMTLREKKTFVVFTLIYTALIFLTSFFLELMSSNLFGGLAGFFVAIFIGTSLILSMLYAIILVSRNRRTWATLKCIGYTNGNIRSIIIGIILFTTFIGLIIVLEVLFHYAAIIGYLQSVNIATNLPPVLVSLTPVMFTSGLFILVQVVAIALANRKILNLRPMIALKKVGE